MPRRAGQSRVVTTVQLRIRLSQARRPMAELLKIIQFSSSPQTRRRPAVNGRRVVCPQDAAAQHGLAAPRQNAAVLRQVAPRLTPS
jgi:hypothetical protein